MKLLKTATLTTLLLCAFSGAAHATCGEDADALAAKYNLSASTVSNTAPAGGNTSDQLAASGGVIKPPATGDMAEAMPPVPQTEPMQTAPAVPSQTAGGRSANQAHASPQAQQAAIDTQAAAVIQDAKNADAHGNEQACRNALLKAGALLTHHGIGVR